MRLIGFMQDHLDESREDHDDLVFFHLDQFSVKGFTAIGAMYLDHGLLVSSGVKASGHITSLNEFLYGS